MEKIKLNNQIVFMRKYVKQAKVHIINKLVKQIKFLQNRKGNEVHIKKAKRKAERFLETVALLKKIKPDDVSKLALSKAKDWKDVLQQKNSILHDRCIAMLANYGAVQKEVEAFYQTNKELVLKISDYFAQWEEKNKFSRDSLKTNKMFIEKKLNKNIQKINLTNEDLLSKKKNKFKSAMQAKNDSVAGKDDTPSKMSLEDAKIHLEAEDCNNSDNNCGGEKIVPIRNIAEIKELHNSEKNSMHSEKLDNNDEENESNKNDEDTSLEDEEMSDNSLSGGNKKARDASNEENIKKVCQSVSKSDLLPEIDNHAKNKIKAIALLNLNELEGLDEIPLNSSFQNEEESEKESSEDEISETSENKSIDPFFLGHNKEDSMQNNSNDPFFLGYCNEDSNAKELDISSKDNSDDYIRTKDSTHSFRNKTQNVKKKIFHRRDDWSNPKGSFQRSSYNHRNVSKQLKIEETKEQPFKTNKFASKNYHKFQENSTSKNKKDYKLRKAPFSHGDVYDKKQFKNISKSYGNKDNIPLKNKMMYKKGNASESLHPSWDAKRKQKELLNASFQGKRMVFND